MPDKPFSLQDVFLNGARRSKTPSTIFLLKGVKLQGVITWFDAFSLLLRRDGASQLVYKHSISTIMPSAQLELSLPEISESSSSGKVGLQEHFLSAAAKEREPMTVFLVNGVMLQGEVATHDQFSLLLRRGQQVQLVYKHAISTLQPEGPLPLGPSEGEA
jgi:host factor-I protein